MHEWSGEQSGQDLLSLPSFLLSILPTSSFFLFNGCHLLVFYAFLIDSKEFLLPSRQELGMIDRRMTPETWLESRLRINANSFDSRRTSSILCFQIQISESDNSNSHMCGQPVLMMSLMTLTETASVQRACLLMIRLPCKEQAG